MSEQQRRMTFFFDAASCSGCKACQVACKDRHGLEVGRLWRRVSEVAGGGWEQDGNAWRNTVFAYHLSMSCNHCERPICLEGCPAKAITKRADGVVLIEPDHCLGCGYCSWVCPYSAPRYQAERGFMSKCSFCADDLDAGLEPACVAACPVRALDAGDPAELVARHGSSASGAGMPPLPDTGLTEPALHLAPHAHAPRSTEPGTELSPRPPRGLREWSLVAFTVLSQTAAGLVLFAGGLRWWLGRADGSRSLDPILMPMVLGLMVAAMLISTLHLGQRRNAVRSLLNLRSSWLSREILLAMILLGATAVAWWPNAPAGAAAARAWAGWLTVPAAVAFLAGMAGVYMQRTVPAWNHWRTPLAFGATALLLGGLATNVALWTAVDLGFEQTRLASLVVMSVCVVGVGGPWSIVRIRRRKGHAGQARQGAVGGLGVIAGLALISLLAAQHESVGGSAPLALSWIGLFLALVDQIGLRREYYDNYGRLGI